MELTDDWEWALRPSGWVRLREKGAEDVQVFLRYALTGPYGHERLVLKTAVLASGHDGLSGRLWRQVPFQKVETRLALLTSTDLPYAQAELVDELRKAFQDPTDEQVPLEGLLRHFEKAPSLDELAIALKQQDSGKVPVVPRPPRGRLTRDFLQEIANAYREQERVSSQPAQDIADASEIPVSSVHRWIYQCRLKGILPKGRPGRAG